ncbi:2-oxoglutarate dehydrogenase complex dihydrolipoyllysine-residue succinyltransferase [Roseobacter sp. HKCCA0434]|uniref:2-oxoglutarate dehydrogenase complex dihydrolipoyllysine-residue succinyltransferase n=1 Tax=Roseobacter sp. HKCCA0434 TaxID=3079297 RepID=UPI0029059376|nr:2-oxoglutarate dehydrogenase complex dihydrolipoyllysine-residue succinyltransferase [Roseobacter sp. HKCCA0434]
MSTEVRVPALGESVTEATVATWFKKPGDAVEVDEMLCELETDKVTVEVPAPAAGTLGELVAAEGETVAPDALLATIEAGAASAGAEDVKPREEAPAKSEDNADGAEAPKGHIDVPVPSLGESVTEATVATWYKKVGDQVAADEMIAELETDKVSVEVPAPEAGTISKIHVQEGETVAAGGILAEMSAEGASVPGPAPDSPKEEVETSTDGAGRKDVENAPSANKLMAEKGLSQDQVQGSGRDGRIMKEDVLKAGSYGGTNVAKSAAAPAPAQAKRAPSPADDAAREERVKMTRLRQTIARRLKDAQNTAAMLTTYNEVDMKAVMDLRKQYKDEFEKKHGVRLGFMSFFTKACVHALNEVPEVNAEIDGDEIVYKNFVHMGVAAGTPTGLVVPVIRDAHEMSFAQIEKAIAEKGRKARDGKLSMAEMQGGTFTISNGGVYGSLMSSPILNPPQSGILGMHKIEDRPVVVGGEIVIRPMMYLALSYDHRIVDGKGAVTFLVRVKEALEDPRRLLMDL